jgi:hypothetical protein
MKRELKDQSEWAGHSSEGYCKAHPDEKGTEMR